MIERDVYRMACNVVCGYDRRKAVYLRRLDELRSAQAMTDYTRQRVSGGESLSTVESGVDKILELEKEFSTQCVHAVDQAKSLLILRYGDIEAERYFRALRLNIADKFRYTYYVLYETMGLGISRRTFFRIKTDFLDEIADFLRLK